MRRKHITKLGEEAFKAFQEGGYQAYLKSFWWRDLKRKRLTGMCRGCDHRRAVTLHHTHYTHLGCEPPGQTIPLCRACHRRLHDHLLEAYPGLSRAKSARHTRKAWSSVFSMPYPSKRRREHPEPDNPKARRLSKRMKAKLSKLPLTGPSPPQEARPTGKPCSALTERINAVKAAR